MPCQSHALGVIACRRANDTLGSLLWGQPRHFVVRPPQLEGKDLDRKTSLGGWQDMQILANPAAALVAHLHETESAEA